VFIASIHIVRCLKIYVHQTIQMDFVSFWRCFKIKCNRDCTCDYLQCNRNRLRAAGNICAVIAPHLSNSSSNDKLPHKQRLRFATTQTTILVPQTKNFYTGDW